MSLSGKVSPADSTATRTLYSPGVAGASASRVTSLPVVSGSATWRRSTSRSTSLPAASGSSMCRLTKGRLFSKPRASIVTLTFILPLSGTNGDGEVEIEVMAMSFCLGVVAGLPTTKVCSDVPSPRNRLASPREATTPLSAPSLMQQRTAEA